METQWKYSYNTVEINHPINTNQREALPHNLAKFANSKFANGNTVEKQWKYSGYKSSNQYKSKRSPPSQPRKICKLKFANGNTV